MTHTTVPSLLAAETPRKTGGFRSQKQEAWQ